MIIARRDFVKKGLMAAFGFILLDAFWIEKFFIEINNFYIGRATKEKYNIKVIQISDLHLQSVGFQLKKLAKKINEIKPQLILFTGDSIDKAENIELLDSFLKLLDFDIKKVAILGNWEYWGKVDLLALNKIYNENNCTLLINQSVQYDFSGKTISITGVDDFLGGKPDLNQAMKSYIEGDYHILLNHCPQYYDEILKYKSESNIDFVLSGHTHGGQVNIFGFIPFLPRGSGRYVKGWYNENIPRLYVSKGIGTSIIPIRFGARSEVSIFYL